MMSGGLASSLSSAIVNQDDPELIRDGAPAYLLLIEGMIHDEPQNSSLLQAGANLYTLYAAIFVDDSERAARIGNKARNFANRALCIEVRASCGLESIPMAELDSLIDQINIENIDALYTGAMSWALWVQQRSGDWNAIAEIPKVEAMLQRVVVLNENYRGGEAHLYLGILKSLLPPALGGRPADGERHFKRALELSKGENLNIHVEYAKRYARTVFDRKLHDSLLTTVINSDPVVNGLTLSNVLAQRSAKSLLADSDDYFLE
ncbi:MAG: TRAP transporter TatT component family protein [Gammaproteobacteria bacterium]|nr:TRAP transporter TatT component family protein [Gammaproteobacteria bacterium]